MMRTLRNDSEFAELYRVRFLPRFGLSRYLYLPSTLQISVSSLYPPLFYTSASLAVQYAAWGSIVSLEIVRAFDEKGTSVTHDGKKVHWWGPGSKSSAGYVERTSCKLGVTENTTAAPVTLIPNVAALELTYAGFKDAVSSDFRDLVDFRIPHLDEFTDEQAFFLTYCYVQCSKKPLRNGDECNVPLKNFPHFGAAFKCAPNAPMNPANKCSFFNVARKPI
ncbi:hypothetical protein HPB50_001620 [Hyalomma asiaticum]|uniref:Uncharacterized protein n=1 Tax=Hyalomma asiaticum TaxID=266040 RepID=A0ACB7S088_HYAAI|nr:hypothetical protein HPB50_001620 [Hyalomma asiaticum]